MVALNKARLLVLRRKRGGGLAARRGVQRVQRARAALRRLRARPAGVAAEGTRGANVHHLEYIE